MGVEARPDGDTLLVPDRHDPRLAVLAYAIGWSVDHAPDAEDAAEARIRPVTP